MKKWYKYEFDEPVMDEQEEYKDEKKILQEHFYNRDYGRLVEYFNFIQKNIGHPTTILSLGSGDCFLEYFLMKNTNIKVSCSDIKKSKWVELLPNINYTDIDITCDVPKEKYDAIISMSVLYQFDDMQLSNFFKNVSSSLNEKGILIIDYGGSSLNPISNFIIDYYLPVEIKIYSVFIWMKKCGKLRYVPKNHVGYRINTEDLVLIAEKFGFVLKNSEYIWDIIDFRRSMLFRMIAPVGGRVEQFIAKLIKKRTSYIRLMMFERKKINYFSDCITR